MKISQNPYIAGKPLRTPQGFFGRQDIIDWVIRELGVLGNNSIVLFGQRRIGKTSLLLQLKNRLPKSIGVPVYFDLMDYSNSTLENILADLSEVITDSIGLPSINRKEFDARGVYFQKKFLPLVFSRINGKLILLLDEFDVLDDSRKSSVSSKEIAKDNFFPFLRKLLAEETNIAFVFVIGRGSEDLSTNILSTFKTSLTKQVWVLNRQAAEDLVRQGEKDGQLIFRDSAVERIIQLTHGHPYLTQLICQRIWQRELFENPSTPIIIDEFKVNKSIEETLEAGSAALNWLWAGLEPSEKLVASLIAELSEENKPIYHEKLMQSFERRDVKILLKEMLLAPKQLTMKNFLQSDGKDRYSFSIELFRRWVRINKPVSLVIDEISETFGDSNIKPFVKEQDARKLYLEDVFSRSNTLAITGIELASRMSEYGLDSLYVPLLADKSNNHPGISSFSKSNNHTRTSIVKLLNQHRFVVVLGDAGSGKSTLVNYLCACFSGEILERRPSIRNLLSELSGDALTKAQWEHGSLIPVKILLRDYAAWAIQSSHYNLWDYVSYLIDSMGLPHYKSELYNELTHDGGIILFDGFDEIPRDGNVLQRIRNEIQTFYEEFPKCRMLLTSRPYAYDTSYFNGVFTTTILQFNKEQIDKYIDNWFSQLAFQSNLSFSEVQIRAEVLKSVIRENEQIYYLAQNPLILTLIVISYARGQQLADDRVGVLSLIMDFFLERWDTNKVVRDYKGEISIIQPGLDEYNKIGGRRFRRAINELAYRVQEKQSESNEMAQIEKDDIIELLSRRADNLNVNYSSLLDYLINRSGILVQRTSGTFTFSHRVFQEFLAASHLAETDYPEMAVSLFMQRPEKWREVIVLTGGIASRGGSFAVVVLANELCAKEPDSKSSTKEAWGAFAASLILMENLKQREPNNREKPVIDRLKKWMQYIDNKDILPSELDFQIKNIRTWLTDH